VKARVADSSLDPSQIRQRKEEFEKSLQMNRNRSCFLTRFLLALSTFQGASKKRARQSGGGLNSGIAGRLFFLSWLLFGKWLLGMVCCGAASYIILRDAFFLKTAIAMALRVTHLRSMTGGNPIASILLRLWVSISCHPPTGLTEKVWAGGGGRRIIFLPTELPDAVGRRARNDKKSRTRRCTGLRLAPCTLAGGGGRQKEKRRAGG
jgi:hypothetical protein